MRYFEEPHDYIAGNFWRICDECGRKIRSSQSKKRWDGLIVCPADWEVRHPQDLPWPVPTDRQAVPEPRPRPTSVFLTATTTVSTAGAIGDSTLIVNDISGMSNGDALYIQLDNLTMQSTTINGAPSGSTITLTDNLTGTVAVGNAVNAYSTSELIGQSDL